MKGPAARTLVLLLPQVGSSTATPAAASSASFASPEGLLGYARLLLSQPQGGKLSVLGGTGNQVHTITSWDPGQQSLDSIAKGFSQWKVTEQEIQNVESSIQEAVQRLFQPYEREDEDAKMQAKKKFPSLPSENVATSPNTSVAELERTPQTSGIRLLVMMSQNRDAGGSADIYHRMVLDAFSKVDARGSDVEYCDALFLDVSSTDNDANSSCVCIAGTTGDIHISTSFYKLAAVYTTDLMLDLAYFHLELSAVAVKGLAGTKFHIKEEWRSGACVTEKGDIIDESLLKHIIPSERDLRLVICQTPPGINTGSCFTPTGGELRKSRTISLHRVKSPMPNLQLLGLPCSSVIPALLEFPLSSPAAQIWEKVKVEDVDGDGNVVLALSSDKDSRWITHLLVWQGSERFSLHALQFRAVRDAHNLEALIGQRFLGLGADESTDEKGVPRTQTVLLAQNIMEIGTANCHVEAPVTGHKPIFSKKRGLEEVEEPLNGTLVPAPPARERKANNSCKQADRSTRCTSLTSSESVIGGPERHSATLVSLLAPIRGVFLSEEPANGMVANAVKCVAHLLQLTEKNDSSLFPLAAEMPGGCRELYKKMWWELKRLAKRTRKDKTQGLEDLAQAIRAARADYKTSEQQLPPTPLPALTEKPTEHVHINKRRRCEEVPRDIHGRPIFPIKLGPSLQVYDLGKVVWNRPAFHSEKYIWPAGYKSRRAYASMLNSENRIFYWCEIVDDGQAPEFRLTPEDDENNPVIGISATAVWTVVVKRVGLLRLEEGGKKTFANVSGPEYFGFANPTIARLIQQLPNSEKCSKYKRQDYFPNVPMRATELDAWQGQGAILNESTNSSPRKDNNSTIAVVEEQPQPAKLRSPQDHGEPPEPEVAETPGQSGAIVAAEDEDETQLSRPPNGNMESELRGMSWDSEFKKAALRKGKLCLTEFSKHFLASNSGSLFSYYWSSKLKRAEVIELDGRK
ncbi:hypothetical protein Mapa_014611 [Marchantia paleacea]|nr:hypothetical protein Mapa_014611 [Marchantia paleacea]